MEQWRVCQTKGCPSQRLKDMKGDFLKIILILSLVPVFITDVVVAVVVAVVMVKIKNN